MNDRYGFVVWSNRTAGTDENCADLVKNDPDYYLGMSEDVVRQISYEACMEEQDILKNEFDSIGVNKVLIFGIIGRWDGAKAAFKVADKIKRRIPCLYRQLCYPVYQKWRAAGRECSS